MDRRTSVVLGVAAGMLISATATAVVQAPPPDDAPRTEMRRVFRKAPPATPVPKPTEEPDHAGSSEGDAVNQDSGPKTERHVIHGSGSIGVVSGTVEMGTTSGGRHGAVTGPARSSKPARAADPTPSAEP